MGGSQVPNQAGGIRNVGDGRGNKQAGQQISVRRDDGYKGELLVVRRHRIRSDWVAGTAQRPLEVRSDDESMDVGEWSEGGRPAFCRRNAQAAGGGQCAGGAQRGNGMDRR